MVKRLVWFAAPCATKPIIIASKEDKSPLGPKLFPSNITAADGNLIYPTVLGSVVCKENLIHVPSENYLNLSYYFPFDYW